MNPPPQPEHPPPAENVAAGGAHEEVLVEEEDDWHDVVDADGFEQFGDVMANGMGNPPQQAGANQQPMLQPDNNNDNAGVEIFFDDGGALEDMENQVRNNPDPVELRIVLNDILGLRGPIITVVKSTFFFFAFNLLYIWSFGHLPLRIGLISPLIGYVKDAFHRIYPYIPDTIQLFFSELFTLTGSSPRLIIVDDIFVILSGYVTICAVVFTLGIVAHAIQSIPFGFPLSSAPHIIRFSLSIITAVSSVLKVGTLLFLRIFWLPLIIGCMALYCANVLFELTRSDLTHFMVENLVGFVSVAWVLGISFMLVVTLSVLQLREVLHPDILARRVRPQVVCYCLTYLKYSSNASVLLLLALGGAYGAAELLGS